MPSCYEEVYPTKGKTNAPHPRLDKHAPPLVSPPPHQSDLESKVNPGRAGANTSNVLRNASLITITL